MKITDIAAEGTQKSRLIYHEDETSLHIGTLPDHAYFIPFAQGENAFGKRESSSRFELLNGDWGFAYYGSVLGLEDDFADIAAEKTIPDRKSVV